MKIKLYGRDTCPDCIRSKRFLEENNIEYEYLDIEKDPKYVEQVLDYNKKLGRGPIRSVPVIVIDDEKILVEPSNEELNEIFH
jgi:glutaredoxin